MEAESSSKSENCFILHLSLHCTSTGECSDSELMLNSLFPTVGDVKKKVEEEFQIPKCLQDLTLNGRGDFEDHSTLRSLYIPKKSIATVYYSSSAQVDFFRRLMTELVRMKETFSNLPQAKNVEWSLIENCRMQLHAAVYTYFLPWTSPSVHANRQFVIQEGGITLVLDLLALVYPVSRSGVPCTTTAVKMALVESLLLFLWCFAETMEDSHLVLEQGAAKLLLKYLHLVSSDGSAKVPKTLYANALGCILAYSDIDSFQITSSPNQQALQQLLKPAAYPPVDNVNSNLQMAIAAVFFYLSHCEEPHAHFTSKPVIDCLFSFIDWILQMPLQPIADNIAMNVYILGITLLRLLVLPPVNGVDLSPALVSRAVAVMNTLVHFVSPDEACRIIEREGFHWRYMFPFIEMGYRVLHDVPCFQSSPHSGPDTMLCLNVALFSLVVTVKKKENRKTVRRQHLLDYFVCLSWHLPNVHKDKYVEGLRLFYSDSPVEVPALGNMVRAKMAAHWPELGLKKATTSTVQELAAALM